MRGFKIFGIIILVVFLLITLLFTLYFLFANGNYGIEVLKDMGNDGFFKGVKEFFVEIWKGFRYAIKH